MQARFGPDVSVLVGEDGQAPPQLQLAVASPIDGCAPLSGAGLSGAVVLIQRGAQEQGNSGGWGMGAGVGTKCCSANLVVSHEQAWASRGKPEKRERWMPTGQLCTHFVCTCCALS